jgi:hypothetical protein
VEDELLGWPIQLILDSFIVLIIPVDPSQVYWMLTAAEYSCHAVGAGAVGEHTERRAQTWLAMLDQQAVETTEQAPTSIDEHVLAACALPHHQHQ